MSGHAAPERRSLAFTAEEFARRAANQSGNPSA